MPCVAEVSRLLYKTHRDISPEGVRGRECTSCREPGVDLSAFFFFFWGFVEAELACFGPTFTVRDFLSSSAPTVRIGGAQVDHCRRGPKQLCICCLGRAYSEFEGGLVYRQL